MHITNINDQVSLTMDGFVDKLRPKSAVVGKKYDMLPSGVRFTGDSEHGGTVGILVRAEAP